VCDSPKKVVAALPAPLEANSFITCRGTCVGESTHAAGTSSLVCKSVGRWLRLCMSGGLVIGQSSSTALLLWLLAGSRCWRSDAGLELGRPWNRGPLNDNCHRLVFSTFGPDPGGSQVVGITRRAAVHRWICAWRQSQAPGALRVKARASVGGYVPRSSRGVVVASYR